MAAKRRRRPGSSASRRAPGFVEAREGLVEQREGGAQGEGAGEVGALRLAAGEARGGAVEQVAHAAGLGGLLEARAAPGGGQAAQAQGEVEVGAQRAREEDGLLEGVGHGGARGGGGPSAQQHAPAAGPLEPGQQAQERRLAGAVGAEQGGHAPRREAQVVHVQHGAAPAGEGDALQPRFHQREPRCCTTVSTTTTAKAMASSARP